MINPSETERESYRFRVKESESGPNWICLESASQNEISALKGGFLGFDLPEGTSLEEAEQLVELLNQKITTISFTRIQSPSVPLLTGRRKIILDD
jgi:hypothetical protein